MPTKRELQAEIDVLKKRFADLERRPVRFDPLPQNPQPFKCSCPPGTVCGNAACPHRMIVTCSTTAPRLGIASSAGEPTTN